MNRLSHASATLAAISFTFALARPARGQEAQAAAPVDADKEHRAPISQDVPASKDALTPAQESQKTKDVAVEAPFAFGDFTWMNGQSRQKSSPLTPIGGVVTPSLYLDVNYSYSGNHPRDNTLTGGASVPRHNEIGINLASVGVEWNYKNVIGRLSLQYGSMINLVQDLDGTTARGRSLTAQNLRYIREATTGYHFDALHGINVEAGIFMSYIGLESYLIAENWNYSRSLVCDHTPFYFQGVRAQIFPSAHVKIEPWLMNGWQTYGKWNLAPSGGMAIRWSPTEAVTLLANFYAGTDTKGVAERVRFHNDHSVLVRYHQGSGFISKAAISLNNHIGFEAGGVDASGNALPGPDHAHMVGTSLVHRVWFDRDRYAFSVRPELFSNPSSYLAQYPPPGFATGPGTKALQAWGLTATFDFMPTDFIAFRLEGLYRKSNVPYFAGPGGTTAPDGFQPTPDAYVPDTRKEQVLVTAGVNFRL